MPGMKSIIMSGMILINCTVFYENNNFLNVNCWLGCIFLVESIEFFYDVFYVRQLSAKSLIIGTALRMHISIDFNCESPSSLSFGEEEGGTSGVVHV